MNQSKPVVLIGPISDDPAESVSLVNRSFVSGLTDRYEFVECRADRSHGTTRQSQMTLWNLYYLLRQGVAWAWMILWRRPAIAHYAVTSGWALEKSLAFLWFASLFRVRTIGHLHTGEFVDHWQGLNGLRRRIATRVLSRIDAVIVLSPGWKNLLLNRVPLSETKIFVVNNPIDQSFEENALQWPISRAQTRLISVGVMGRDKGVLDIVEATALVRARARKFAVQLAGPEREPGIREQVIQRIKAHSLEQSIEVRPTVHGAGKLALFREASIFLLPSYYENFPLVLLEAAAAGQAIITTSVGAVPEFFVDGESAIFVEPGNVGQLAAAMLRLVANEEERTHLAVAARSLFLRRLGRSHILTSLEEVYRRMLIISPDRTPSAGAALQSFRNCD